jgi:tripartite-type tricarboxylate transporter receptor subunit TctC
MTSTKGRAVSLRRRSLLAATGAAALTWAPFVRAQRKLLRMVVPLTPGTTPDLVARSIGPLLQARLGMDFVVENKAGASGMIGMGFVAKSTDPGTLLIVPATTVTLPLFYKTVDFEVMNSFTPVTQVCSSSFVLVVHKDVPANNLPEFVSWAKSRTGLFYASPGSGTHHHLFMELLLQSIGAKIEHVPYKGSAPALNDVLGGQVPTTFLPIQIAVPLRDTGRLKIIGGSLRERHPGFPDIPSLQEQGARNYHADPWFSVWGTPRMPPGLVEQYRTAIAAALEDATVKESLTKQGLILKTGTPAELAAMTRAESALWTRVVRESNIKPE